MRCICYVPLLLTTADLQFNCFGFALPLGWRGLTRIAAHQISCTSRYERVAAHSSVLLTNLASVGNCSDIDKLAIPWRDWGGPVVWCRLTQDFVQVHDGAVGADVVSGLAGLRTDLVLEYRFFEAIGRSRRLRRPKSLDIFHVVCRCW
ncbi:hypothetical protein GGS24DRAFT_27722 [Hypoxylon argillaceum]|nr:hypothetical protein GGS24DRAFT_27722 [Hypoxylon argillaceum]